MKVHARTLATGGIILSTLALVLNSALVMKHLRHKTADRITTKETAIYLASTYTGFDASQITSITSESDNQTTAAIPFLHAQYAQRKTWTVKFGNIAVKDFGNPDGPYAALPQTFIAVLAASNGALLSIDSDTGAKDPDMYPEPSAASAEKQLNALGEKYLALPSQAPNVTFAYLLKDTGASFAKQIHALYVTVARQNYAPARLWILTLRGLPPMEPKGGGDHFLDPKVSRSATDPESDPYHGVPLWQINYAVVAFDATTGQELFLTNIPGPEAPHPQGTH